MESFTQILPLAITMMAGPQIISAIILITSKYPVKSSLFYVLAVSIATFTGTLALYLLFKFIGLEFSGTFGNQSLSKLIETILVGLLFYLSIKAYFKRTEIKPPKWMKSLQDAEPRKAFILGLTLIFLMPSDIIIMTTVGFYLASKGLSYLDTVPFVLATSAIAALPLLIYLLFKKRAEKIMPKVKIWTDKNSWIIQIVVYIIFIVLIWK